MPVTALQHRVIIGLFQSKIMVWKYFCDMDFINEFVNFVLVMIICGVSRTSLSILFESCNIAFMKFYKAQYMYEVPLIYDPLAFGLVICCNLVLPAWNRFPNKVDYRN